MNDLLHNLRCAIYCKIRTAFTLSRLLKY